MNGKDLCTHRLLIAARLGGCRNRGLNIIMAGLTEKNLVDTIVALLCYKPTRRFIHQTKEGRNTHYKSIKDILIFNIITKVNPLAIEDQQQ